LGDNLNPSHEYDKDNILDLKFGVDDNTRVNKVGVNNSTFLKIFIFEFLRFVSVMKIQNKVLDLP